MSELQITVERNQGGLFQRAIGRFGVAIVVVPKIGSGAGSPFVLLPGERIKESLLEKSHHYDVYVIPADNYAEMFRAEGTLANSIKCTFKGTVYYRLNIDSGASTHGLKRLKLEDAATAERRALADLVFFQGKISDAVIGYVEGRLRERLLLVWPGKNKTKAYLTSVKAIISQDSQPANGERWLQVAVTCLTYRAQNDASLVHIPFGELGVKEIEHQHPGLAGIRIERIDLQECTIPLYVELSARLIEAQVLHVPPEVLIQDPDRLQQMIAIIKEGRMAGYFRDNNNLISQVVEDLMTLGCPQDQARRILAELFASSISRPKAITNGEANSEWSE